MKHDTRLLLSTVLLLALPLLAIGLWLALLGAGYGAVRWIEGWVAALALSGFVTVFARWRVLGPLSWPVAWLLYLVALMVALADAMAWYFQGASFSIRFFANIRLDNIATGWHAFPLLLIAVPLLLAGMLVLSAWLLRRVSHYAQGMSSAMVRVPVLLALIIIAIAVPSAWRRLGRFAMQYRSSVSLAGSAGSNASGLLANPDPIPRSVVRAAAGKNLVIVYMESLERIYTDNRIFPGLTPNLNHWRARGLDYTDYLTFTGADYTIAGMFASQCGAPYLPSPVKALALGGNNANASGFQPSLACLGDILHAAGYEQTFIQGIDSSFAGVGMFYRMHGFNHVLGLKDLEAAHAHDLASPGWGLYDSELFRLAAAKFDKLADAGKPFNLDVLTIDNHPPHGRPSPGCPKYAANNNDVLQAVHCTDYLVGKFLDTISKSPAWKNTIVVVMSDHQSMRNDAWPLYPKSYKRRPLLFVLNGGHGKRDMRFYHMDIAPTVLHLMGVQTNATFLAGADRSAPNAPGSPLINTPTDLAVLRKAIWQRAQPLQLCKSGVLVGAADDGATIGGFSVPWSWRGRPRVGLRPHGAWFVSINHYGVHGTVLNSAQGDPLDEGGVAARLTARAPGESVLLVEPLDGIDPAQQFSVDWIGKQGGRTHLADVPRLRGLEIAAPDCATLLTRMDALPAGQRLDLSRQFKAFTALLYPSLPDLVWFNKQDALPFERELGWAKPESWGVWTIGGHATLGFTLPRDHCHAMDFDFKVHPYFAASRPRLDVNVYANGALMTTWRLSKQDTPPTQTWQHVFATVRTSDPACKVYLRFVFQRPGAPPPPYPADEDRRPLQLLFLSMQPAAEAAVAAGN